MWAVGYRLWAVGSMWMRLRRNPGKNRLVQMINQIARVLADTHMAGAVIVLGTPYSQGAAKIVEDAGLPIVLVKWSSDEDNSGLAEAIRRFAG